MTPQLPKQVLEDAPFLPLALDAIEDECGHLEQQNGRWSGRSKWVFPVAWLSIVVLSSRLPMAAMMPFMVLVGVLVNNWIGNPRRKFRALLHKYVLPQLVEGMHHQWRFKMTPQNDYIAKSPTDRPALEVLAGRVRVVKVHYELGGAYAGHRMRFHKLSAAYRDMGGVSRFFRGALVRLELPVERQNRILILPRDTPNISVYSTHLFGLHQGAFYKLEAQDEGFERHYRAYATLGDEAVFSEDVQRELAAFAERHEVALYALLVSRYLYVAIDHGTTLAIPNYEERESLQEVLVMLHGELRVVRDGLKALEAGGALG